MADARVCGQREAEWKAFSSFVAAVSATGIAILKGVDSGITR